MGDVIANGARGYEPREDDYLILGAGAADNNEEPAPPLPDCCIPGLSLVQVDDFEHRIVDPLDR